MQYTQEQTSRLFEFSAAKANLTKLIGGWDEEVKRSEKRRQFRKIDIDVELKRQSKEIDPDETILPVRVVDENIEKEMPSYVSYLTQAEHLVIFNDDAAPSTNTDLISNNFTRGMKYIGWEKIWFRSIDGAHLHGADAIEVLYDQTKPLHVGHEHVGHDCLFYSRDIYDIQDAPIVLRKYMFSGEKLRGSVTNSGFNEVVVTKILEELKDDAENSTSEVYKVYFRYEGYIYIAWYSPCGEEWLKKPEKLFLGVRKRVEEQIIIPVGGIHKGLPVMQPTPITTVKWVPEYETAYPIFVLAYKETEEKKLVEKKGRGFYDQYRQEGQTAILSGYVNALNRSTRFMAFPKQGGSGASVKQTQPFVKQGLYNEPLEIFQSPYPDSVSILGALQYLDASGAREINQLTEVLRRKKGEKTATEVETAQKETSLLAGVKLVLFSTFVRQVYTHSWRLVQSLALQGEIPFMMQQENNGRYINDDAVIGRSYTLVAAGDVEVVQRAQKLDRMMQFWPIVSMTSVRDVFFLKMLKMLFPEDYNEYASAFQANQVGKQLVGTLGNMVQSMVQKYPQELTSATPEQQAQLQAVQQQAQQYLAMP